MTLDKDQEQVVPSQEAETEAVSQVQDHIEEQHVNGSNAVVESVVSTAAEGAADNSTSSQIATQLDTKENGEEPATDLTTESIVEAVVQTASSGDVASEDAVVAPEPETTAEPAQDEIVTSTEPMAEKETVPETTGDNSAADVEATVDVDVAAQPASAVEQPKEIEQEAQEDLGSTEHVQESDVQESESQGNNDATVVPVVEEQPVAVVAAPQTTEEVAAPVEQVQNQPDLAVTVSQDENANIVTPAELTGEKGAQTAEAKPRPRIPTVTANDQRRPDPSSQTVDVGDGVRRRSSYSKGLVMRRFEDITTSYASFKRAVERFGDKDCLGHRPILPDGTAGPMKYMTYSEVHQRSKNTAAGLRELGLPSEGRLAIFSVNRPEWMIVAQACSMQSICSLSLYETLGDEASVYILNHGEVQVLCVGPAVLKKALQFVNKAQFLKNVVLFDTEFPQDAREQLEQANIGAYTLADVEKIGAQNPCPDVPPHPDTLYTIMYTSGTTGLPKGVMLTHRNIVAAIAGVYNSIPLPSGAGMGGLAPGDVLISYLPLAHILERVAEELMLQEGVAIGYWQGDIKRIRDDFTAIRPTIMPAVPRVLDRLYDGINGQLSQRSSVSKLMFGMGFSAKQRSRAKNGNLWGNTPVWDRIVFNKFKNAVGGRMRGILSGGAPLRPEVQTFLSTVFDCPIVQGYGLTECCATATMQVPGDPDVGHIGPSMPCNEIKLVDVPEMNYLTSNDPPTGEVCIRGPNICLGYYKDEVQTKEVFDDDGFFHTGDVGRWNANGTLSIIDRKKNIFKLAQGEYVAAENVETKLVHSAIGGVWVYGDSMRSFLVAVCSVIPDHFIAFAKQQGFENASRENLEQLCKEEKLRTELQLQLAAEGKNQRLQGFEIPKRLWLITHSFETIPKCVTPTMKLVRSELRHVFQAEIDQMYAEVKDT